MTIRHVESFFRPKAVLGIGRPADVPAEEMLRRLTALPDEYRALYAHTLDGWRTLGKIRDATNYELGIVFDAAEMTPSLVRGLTEQGCRALIWLPDTPVPEAILRAGRDETLRVLGPGSSGAAHARTLSLSAWGLPAAGTTALIAQSRSIAAAALDWAAGHALGFSWIAVTGGEADVDVADLLDYAALDPSTQAVVLQLSHIRSPRKFMSAARACARSKPVVVLQTPDAHDDAAQPTDPVLSAAFRRAGLVEVDRITAIFSALAAMSRIGEAMQGRIAVVGTGSGICQLARASLWREGLTPAAPSDGAWTALREHLPDMQSGTQWLDVGLASDEQTLDALRATLAAPGVDMVMFVRSPAPGRDDEAFAQRLVTARLRERLVVVFLGQARAAPALRRCAEGGIAAFASVEAAARALRYRREHRRTQELLMQTPTLDPLAHGREPPVLPVPAKLKGSWVLPAADAAELLIGYGLQPAAWAEAAGRGLRVKLKRHPEMGVYIEARLDPASAAAPTTYALPPVDDVLATTMLGEIGLGSRVNAPLGLRASDYATAVARLSQLAVEQPRLLEADVRLLPADGIAEIGYARLVAEAEPPSERDRLALAPYPSALARVAPLKGERQMLLRVIRPTDEPALIRMLSELDPEEIRLRFFRYIRQFTHAMAARMSQIDYDREMTFVAEADSRPGELAGVSTLVSDPTGSEAEFAALVHHNFAGLGLGRQLMRAILDYGAQRGIRRIYGDVLLENAPMLALSHSLGFRRERHPDDPGCVRVVLEVPPEKARSWTTLRSFART
ncbi:bifunctional acetate--CoA ligase family protein/GNAT family N-acetyltransferase [Solimonas flava]|uniref:bifunctional acetate--CoA ligase family protein/GNAT family N-acetyltransferase n=1 Tax=Solimonas flava TaxID=415849 RepID=UPI00041F71E2|nr:GNAT family N-acetyltransferase [Solimonas flava]